MRLVIMSVAVIACLAAPARADDMQPTLSEAENCVFTTRIRPVSDEATRAAAGALATLRTRIELQDL